MITFIDPRDILNYKRQNHLLFTYAKITNILTYCQVQNVLSG